MLVYKIENNKTGSVYISQTNNLNRRIREHRSNAQNPNSNEYNKLLYKKIREYGFNNFTITIVKDNLTTEEANLIEIENIKEYNSFKGVGYNQDYGGSGVSIDKELKSSQLEIKDLLLNSNITQREIASKYLVSESLISNINTGLDFNDSNISYPIRKNNLDKEYELIIKELEETTKTFIQISIQYNVSESYVKKINYGKIRNNSTLNYPIRKISGQQQKANIAIDLLIEGGYSYDEIAKLSNLSKTTVGRLNRGETRKRPNLVYPLQ